MPPRAVLDASVLVPRWSRGALRRLALLDPAPYQPVWSTAIVGEVWRVLTTQRLRRGDPTAVIASAAHAMWRWLDPIMAVVPAATPPPGVLPSPLRDPRDEHLWNAALHASAAYVVSHNTRRFPPPVPLSPGAGSALRHLAHGVEFVTAIEFIEEVLGFDAATLYGAPIPAGGIVRSARSRR